MSKTSIQILPDTSGSLNVVGAKFQADGFYGFTDGKHTVGWYLNQFIGRVSIEATLAENPENIDWFPVTFDNELNEYVQYDAIDPGDELKIFTFTGNFVWIRAVISRAHIVPSPNENVSGNVRKVLLNH